MTKDIGEFEIAYHKNGVEFTRESIHSGERNSMVVGLTMMQFTLALQKWIKREGFIQDIFPTLDADTREFIQTGITPSEWADIFGPEETDTDLNNAEVP